METSFIDLAIMFPKSGVGGIIPNPRKLRADCATKAVENEIIAITSSSGKMFGITCLKKIVKSEAFDNLAESMNA